MVLARNLPARIALLLMALCAVLISSAAHAEGSRELSANGNNRAWLEVGHRGAMAGVPLKSYVEAYARANEVIALGSSAHAHGSGRIHWRGPNGRSGTCSITQVSGQYPGRILNRAEEVAGPRSPSGFSGGSSSGYRPCFVNVGADAGVWRIEFTSPANNNNNSVPISASGNWTQPTSGSGSAQVAAWDVTVFGSSGKQSGRVWADYLALNAGQPTSGDAFGSTINLKVHVLTRDGYLYEQLQTINPLVYLFFANNRGVIDQFSDEPTYTSRTMTADVDGTIVDGRIHGPNQRDTDIHVTHKLFFNPPSPSLPESADSWDPLVGEDWLLRSAPKLPPQPEQVVFTGNDGTPGQAAGGNGGVFTFVNPSDEYLTVEVTLPFSANGVNTDRKLVGFAPPGAASLEWDGLDGSGNPVVAGDTDYEITTVLLGGEVHFPFMDVEGSTGLRIERKNGPVGGGPNRPGLVYWDHRPATAAATGSYTQAIQQLNGHDTTVSRALQFTRNWGDAKILDTWAYLPSATATPEFPVRVREADLRIVKTADFAPVGRGGVAAYTLTIDNLSVHDFARAVQVLDDLPATISNVEWTCEIVEQGVLPADVPSRCYADEGSGDVDVSLDLRTGAQAVIRIRGTVTLSPVSSISNTATVSRAADAGDPVMSNNTSTVEVGTVPGRSVSGYVYEDLQPNNVRDPEENWQQGAPVWVTLIHSSGHVMDSRQVTPGNGYYSFPGVPAGTYQLVVTQEEMAVLPMPPPGFQFMTPGSGTLADVEVATANVANLNFGLFRVMRVEGRVFEDNGIGGGVAHDGIRNGAETGLGGVLVEARQGSTVLASALTDADGLYSLLLPSAGGSVDIVAQTPAGYVSVSERTGDTGAANAEVFDDTISFTPVSGGSYSGVDFGDVREPVLAPDQVRTAAPGSVVFLPHVFTAHTTGSVSFHVVSASAVPDIPGWSTQIHRDSNCNGVPDAGEPALDAAVPVNAEAQAQICLVLRLFVPPGVPVNAQWQGRVEARMQYVPGMAPTPRPPSERQVDDLVTVNDGDSLVLIKEVDRPTALPGQTLTYTLTYRNPGSQPLGDVVIRDVTPPFTLHVGASAVCFGALPAAIVACSATRQPGDAEAGELEWTLQGLLQPGAEGRVRYQVEIEP